MHTHRCFARYQMRTPPLDPDVADAAPSGPVLTVYDEQHVVTYMRILAAESTGRIGKKSRGSCCILIPSANQFARAMRLIAIWPAPNG